MSSVKVIKAQRKQKLLIDGHYFIKFNEEGDTASWCCDKKGALNCRSIVKTWLVDGNYDIKEGPTEHAHEDSKKRKLIVTTPRRSIFTSGKHKFCVSTPLRLDFEEENTTTTENPAKITKKTPKKPKKSTLKETNGVIPCLDQPIEPDYGAEEIKFVKCQSNKPHKLFVDGFYYTCKCISMKTVVWLCCHTKLKCPARILTNFSSGEHKLKRPPNGHNHDNTDVPLGIHKYVDSLPEEERCLRTPIEYSTVSKLARVKKTRKKNKVDENKPPNVPATGEAKPTASQATTQSPREVRPLKDTNSNEIKIPTAPPKRKVITRTHDVPIENAADVSMHTQMLSHIPQADVVEFQPPEGYEIEFVILFGLRREMTPEQIFYELQAVYGIDAPSYETVCDTCNRLKCGYYPMAELDELNETQSVGNVDLCMVKQEPADDLNMSVGY